MPDAFVAPISILRRMSAATRGAGHLDLEVRLDVVAQLDEVLVAQVSGAQVRAPRQWPRVACLARVRPTP